MEDAISEEIGWEETEWEEAGWEESPISLVPSPPPSTLKVSIPIAPVSTVTAII